MTREEQILKEAEEYAKHNARYPGDCTCDSFQREAEEVLQRLLKMAQIGQMSIQNHHGLVWKKDCRKRILTAL